MCSKYSMNELNTFIATQSIIEDVILSISRVVELTDQLAEVNKNS